MAPSFRTATAAIRRANVMQTFWAVAANVLQTPNRRNPAKPGETTHAIPRVFGVSCPCSLRFAEHEPIGETGFEPATARPPAGCATRLRHSPWPGLILCCRTFARVNRPCLMGTYVRVNRAQSMQALRATQAGDGVCLAAKGARPTRQLLPGLSSRLQTPALFCPPRALRRERCATQADHRRGARLSSTRSASARSFVQTVIVAVPPCEADSRARW